jgi:hypothetical protein
MVVSRRSSNLKRILLIVVVTLVFIATLITLGGLFLQAWQAPTLKVWRQVTVGATEEAVLELVGVPDREYMRDSAPTDYYAKELSYRARPITSKVFIYRGQPDLTMFVWFDENGVVEDIFIGGS